MKKEMLIELIRQTPGDEVVLNGVFGNTYVDIQEALPIGEGKILLRTAKDPLPAPPKEETEMNLDDLVFEIKQFVGTEPEMYEGIGIGLHQSDEELEGLNRVYLESEQNDGTFSMVTMSREEALWVSKKIWEYAAKIKKIN